MRHLQEVYKYKCHPAELQHHYFEYKYQMAGALVKCAYFIPEKII